MTSTLMILAGSKAAGKSSLIDMAYRQNIALFGPDCAALFRAHNPDRFPKQKIFIDALMESFLRSAFVRLCETIHVNTLKSTFETCMKQFRERDGANLFQSDEAAARRVYKELYDCWSRHLDVLNPAQRPVSFFEDGKLHIPPTSEPRYDGCDGNTLSL